MKKRIVALVLGIILVLAVAAPALAHPFPPNTLPPSPPIACPGCGTLSAPVPGFIPIEIMQGNFPCWITPGCIVHEHYYNIMYICPKCGLQFMTTWEYVFWHTIPPCPGQTGWMFVRYGP